MAPFFQLRPVLKGYPSSRVPSRFLGRLVMTYYSPTCTPRGEDLRLLPSECPAPSFHLLLRSQAQGPYPEAGRLYSELGPPAAALSMSILGDCSVQEGL